MLPASVGIGSGCGPQEVEDPSVAYRTCSDQEPCAEGAECVFGLCVAECPGAPVTEESRACTEGLVCWEDGCRAECDDAHPCTQAYSCVAGRCEYRPCEHPEFWSKSLASASYPVLVHYRDDAELESARAIVGALEQSWQFETESLGFLPPVSDQSTCGPDDGFDVFVWRTFRGGVADVIAEEPSTAWNDYRAYVIVDPWGPYGGENLEPFVAHELNHSMQAAYDWYETPIFFEMTSQFVEEVVYDGADDYRDYFYDYQGNPDWAFDYNDNYQTSYFYGASLYLFYLRDGVFGGEPSFISEIWDRSRNPAGENEPDFEDALESVLQQRHGVSFQDTLIEFARWRYFTGARDDGRHFEEGSTFPENALVKIEQRHRVANMALEIPGPMLLGTQYIQLYREAGDPSQVTLSFDGEAGVHWVVQAVPGLAPDSDGELLDFSSGTAQLDFGALEERSLVVLALPKGADDPDTRDDTRHPYTISVSVP